MIQINKKFIFVHNPKAAGSSLRTSIRSIFGKENLFEDYNRPNPTRYGTFVRSYKSIISSFSTKKIKQKIIYGHLMPCKYCDFRLDGFHKRKDYVYLTFLRDPLQRVISLYYFFQRDDIPPNPDPIRIKILKEKMSLETFLTYKGFWQNFYSKYFFGFPVEKFDFIGIAENYSSSIKTLNKMFKEFRDVQILEVNVNKEKQINQFYEVDKTLELKFREFNKKDYEIYEKAKAINHKLINEYNP